MATSTRVKLLAAHALSLYRKNDALPYQSSRRKARRLLKMIEKTCPHIEKFVGAHSNDVMHFHKCGLGLQSYSVYDLSRTLFAKSLHTAHFVITYVRNPDFRVFVHPKKKFPSLKNLTLHFADDMQYLPQFSQAVRNVNMWSHVPNVTLYFQMCSPVFTTTHVQAFSNLSLTSLRHIKFEFPRRLRYDKNGVSLRNFAGIHAHIPPNVKLLTVVISGSLYARTIPRFWERFFRSFGSSLKQQFPGVRSTTSFSASRTHRTDNFYCNFELWRPYHSCTTKSEWCAKLSPVVGRHIFFSISWPISSGSGAFLHEANSKTTLSSETHSIRKCCCDIELGMVFRKIGLLCWITFKDHISSLRSLILQYFALSALELWVNTTSNYKKMMLSPSSV